MLNHQHSSSYNAFFLTTKISLLFLLLVIGVSETGLAQKIVWREEFAGKQLDHKTWIHDIGGHGFGNGQLEFNTDRPENAYLKDGRLVIEARREKYSGREFTSARISTQGRFAFQYGTLVARIQVPDTANGIWPAFWLLGDNFPAINWPNCGEVDILEIGGKTGISEGKQQRRINCALHFAGGNGAKKSLVRWHDSSVDLSRGFHLYQVSWTPESLVFSLDDKVIAQWKIDGPESREFHQPFYPILNVAVGSFKNSYTGIDSPEKITASFPAKMQVDWIRLYANHHTKVFRGEEPLKKGRLGVFAEEVDQKLDFGDFNAPVFAYSQQAAMLAWNNVVIKETEGEAGEGKRKWTLDIKAGQWFGAGVLVARYRNLSQYSDGFLSFHIRTASKAQLRVGIKSSRGGESWLPIGSESDEFGFARDGKWHSVKVPVNKFSDIDFRTVHQLFMIAGDPPDHSFQLELDNICWSSH